MTATDEEKVCLTKTQMDNILDANRAYATGKGTDTVCPKALNWVSKYRPIKKKKEKAEKGIIERHLEKKAGNVVDRFLDKIFGIE